MKKQFLRVFLTVVITVLMFALSMSGSAAFSMTDCQGESVEVYTFAEFKTALENYSKFDNIVLKNNITITDDANSYMINITKSGAVAVDFNGYKLKVNSKATKYLFNVTGQSHLYFVDSMTNGGEVVFNTTQPEAALVRVSHVFAKIYNVNADFIMGDTYKTTTDSSDTAVFRVDLANDINILGGVVNNAMLNGNGVCIVSNGDNKGRLNVRIGGATLQADKHCVTFDPDYVASISLGSGRFESLNSNKGLYERIKVPASSVITVKDLWYTSAAGSDAYIYIGGSRFYDTNRKVKDLSKSDINVDKMCCDGLSNASDFILLRCAGGHVRICGSCNLKFRYFDSHNFKKQNGTLATCTTNGKTTGQKCSDCKYSTSKTIPKTGHKLTYVQGQAASCGVDGIKEHYYCTACKSYFSDAAGNNEISQSSVVIKNNHVIENKSAVSATCTKTGLTAGIYCQTCKTYKLKQETIPAKGHDYSGNWVVTHYPSCQEEGLKVNTCNNCNEKQEQSIAKTAHVDSDDDGKCDICRKKLTIFDDVTPEAPDYPNDSDNGNNNSNSGNVNCNCNCHAKGIKNFFFKIGLFFQRIFRTNKYCKGCGVAHY